MLKKSGKVFNHVLNIGIAFSLIAMAVLVFGNVVLRYAFNSGITWSEEMSRFLFVWLVFLGAIAAFKDNMHLGVDIVTNMLPEKVKKIAFVISNLLVLYVLWLLLEGSWKMTLLNMSSLAPATKIPLGFVYGIGIVASIGMGAIAIINFYKAFRGKNKSGQFSLVPDHAGEAVNEAANTHKAQNV
ncbi:TRAP transporter small permease [Bacillus taeanensis]|uniref:TRAP transporter small permease n=1 Tax=Bacillus taeanensis TaxID=273032 RepID=A0A366Y3I7_9BACI|nr:TRAP transporter small permease [Bacillus taeanensis]RBW70944.1 TRAP transporter small permease [Bacillus taeanensis]